MKKQLIKKIWNKMGLIAILFSFTVSWGQQPVVSNDTAILQIGIVKKANLRKPAIFATLFSNQLKSIRTPSIESIQFGYPNDSSSDFTFEVFEIRKTQDILLTPTADYQYLRINKKFVELKPKDSITYFFPIDMFLQLTKRKKYKVRLKLKLSKWNDKSDIYSNWLSLKP